MSILNNEPTSVDEVGSSTTVRLTEIFYSLQGEGRYSGLPTVFVRLTGCPLRCTYCDTAYAFDGGQSYTLDEVLAQVDAFGAKYVTVTGGEPLAQKTACEALMRLLCDKDYSVSLETSGAMDIADVDSRVSVVMDLKTPDSGELEKNLYANLAHIRAKDQLKFVLCSRADYDWAKSQLIKFDLAASGAELLFSSSYYELPYKELAGWIIKDRLPVRMQLQQHKIIWGEEPGR